MSDSTDTPAASGGIRAQVAAAADKPRCGVLVQEWGTTVYIRTARSDEVTDFLTETSRRRKKTPGKVRFAERLIILTATDANGSPVFTADDEDMLAGRGMGAIDKLLRVACRMNGLSSDEADAGN
jgi:hypothetical protein